MVGAFLAFVGTGCDSNEVRYPELDEPEPVPSKVPAPTAPEGGQDLLAQSKVPEPGECTRGTARKEDGTCIPLKTRVLEHAQQVLIPAGDFVMGHVPSEYDAAPARLEPKLSYAGQPPRPATADAFWIDVHEVTRQAYSSCVAAGQCTPAQCPEGTQSEAGERSEEVAEALPQTCVTHAQARAFCRWIGGDLPTEIQWEYAARGVDARLFPWGNDIKDELPGGLNTVSFTQVDPSYFGVLGMGINASEWVADTYAPDVGLADFLEGPFRDERGPLMKSWRAGPPAHVVKGGYVGARQGARGPNPERGFRCASAVGPQTEPLRVPEPAASVPLVRSDAGLQIFGGVAEAVTRAEAERFCDRLNVEWGGTTFEAWRLPTLEEIQAASASFRGPGPFWTGDGAAVQEGEGARARPEDPWVAEPTRPRDVLFARCVHD